MTPNQAAILDPPLWTPLRLPASARGGLWDAMNTPSLSLSGSNVTAWADRFAAAAVSQGTGADQPTYSAAGFNGGPGLAFDGVTQNLAATPAPAALPTGSTEGWFFALVKQDALPANTTIRFAAGMGGDTANAGRRLGRAVTTGVNRMRADNFSTNLLDTAVDLSGYHLLAAKWSADPLITGRIDGAATSPATATPASLSTATSRFRIGATCASTLANTWQGMIARVLVTGALTAEELEKVEGWMVWPYGLQALLPSTHRFRNAPPR